MVVVSNLNLGCDLGPTRADLYELNYVNVSEIYSSVTVDDTPILNPV